MTQPAAAQLLSSAWQAIVGELASLPQPLAQQGTALLASMAARNRAASAQKYFEHPGAYPTPQVVAWLGQHYLPSEPEFVAAVMTAALQLFLFVRLQDDVLDGAADSSLLLLGNICLQRGLAGLLRLRPNDVELARETEHAWTAFSAATAWEKHAHWGWPAPFTEEDLYRLGEKFAAIRLPVATLLCQSGRTDLIGAYAECLQRLGIAIQMLNDLDNWREDLGAGNYTYFLTQAGNCPENAILRGTAAEQCLDIACSALDQTMDSLPNDAPAELVAYLRQQCLEVARRRQNLVRVKLGLGA